MVLLSDKRTWLMATSDATELPVVRDGRQLDRKESMFDKDIDEAVRKVRERVLPDGGFAESPGGTYRADATAWAIIALTVTGARRRDHRCCEGQAGCWPGQGRQDTCSGRIPVRLLADASRSTCVVRQPIREAAGSLAVDFLLGVTGRQVRKRRNSPTADDPSDKGVALGREHSLVG